MAVLELCGETLSGILLPGPEPETLQIYFCCSGSLSVQQTGAAPLRVRSNEFLLLSDHAKDLSLRAASPLSAICLTADLEEAREPLEQICETMRLHLGREQVDSLLEGCGGCLQVPNMLWSRSAGTILQCLPAQEQGAYWTLKCLELLYLLCIRSRVLAKTVSVSPNWRYLSQTISAVAHYMEEHLDEKLTIASMSHRFQISPTALKSGFRSLYGQPIHSWLLGKRLECAAGLLLDTAMTVLQVAQEVGYESAGQFGVVFHRQYGVTPSQYRKMSHSKNT